MDLAEIFTNDKILFSPKTLQWIFMNDVVLVYQHYTTAHDFTVQKLQLIQLNYFTPVSSLTYMD